MAIPAIRTTLLWLSQMLYPKGRAFRMPENGILYRLHRAISIRIGQAYVDAFQIQNDMLPDNSGFTIDDAHDWYRRLGIYDSGLVPLADMKLAIAQKMSFPITPLNKQNYLFIQQQLRAAGFDVYVYENRFPDGMGGWVTKTPDQFAENMTAAFEYGDPEYGDPEYGEGFDKIANYIEESKDALFVVGTNYRSTFFIAGSSGVEYDDPMYGDPEYGGLSRAYIQQSRHYEFRQLILKLKPAQTVGFLFINYTN